MRVGSTPTALSARHLDGVTEVRAGVYVFFDMVMADVGEKAINQVREITKELLTRTQSVQHSDELASVLATGTWTHDYPISSDEAQRLGLKVSTEMPNDVMRLMSLYPQPMRRQPAVIAMAP